MNKVKFSLIALSFGASLFAQDNLVNSLKNNHSENPDFKFTIIKENGASGV